MKRFSLRIAVAVILDIHLGLGSVDADEVRQQLLSDPALSMYISFDEGADASINTGSVHGATSGESELVDGVVGKALSLMKEQEGAPALSYDVGRSFNPERGTLMFWFQPGWGGEEPTGKYSLVWISMLKSDHYFALHRSFDPNNSRTLYSNFHWDNSLQIPTPGKFFPHQWTHIAVTWDQEKEQYAFYMDGKLVVDAPWRPLPDDGQYRATRMHLGRFYPTDSPINAAYDEFYIFDRSLSPSEINEYVNEVNP